MPWQSRIPVMQQAMERALSDGVTAGAYHYANAMKRALAGGYTSGDFVTGATVNHVTVIPAQRTTAGFEAKVGTDLLYNLFWEIGHLNLFTRQYERVEVWRPTLVAEAGRIAERIRSVAAARIVAMGAR